MPKHSMLVACAFLVASLVTAQVGSAHLESMTPASKNSATVAKQCQITRSFQGSTVNAALAKKVMSETMELYAGTINCNFVSTSAEFGSNLIGVPWSACVGEIVEKLKGMQLILINCGDITADASGKIVMSYQHNKIKLTTGEEVALPVVNKYEFDDAGKIAAYSTQFDASVLDGMTPASINSATVAKQCQISRSFQGSTVNAALAKKATSEMMGFYAGKTDCNFVSTSAEFGFNLVGVPWSACVGEIAEKLKGMQLILINCGDVTADASGKIVMSYQYMELKLTTGEEVPLPIVNKYEFDDAGKIAATSTQFDTSVLMASAVRLSSTASWGPSPTLAIPAVCVVGAAAAAAVLARVISRQSPRLPEGYEECA